VQEKFSSCFYYTLKLPAQAPQHKECNSVFVARHTALLYVNRQGKDTQLFLVHGIEVGRFSSLSTVRADSQVFREQVARYMIHETGGAPCLFS
jgi:hypothetical protein